jgi:hypothetical protein
MVEVVNGNPAVCDVAFLGLVHLGGNKPTAPALEVERASMPSFDGETMLERRERFTIIPPKVAHASRLL